MALGVVYFRFTHRLGRPNYVWNEYLYSVLEKVAVRMTVRPGADESSKAAFCKSAFAKSKLTFGKSAFARSRFAFRHSIFASQKALVWPSATSKMLSPKTYQNVLEIIFAFDRLVCAMSYLKKESTL